MTIGPIQMIVFDFDRIDRFHGDVIEELTNLRESGVIRLVDLLLAVKEPTGEIVATEMAGLTDDEAIEFGYVIGKLMGLSDLSLADSKPDEVTADAVERMLANASQSVGLDYQGINRMVETLEPGKAFGVLLFEHTWAIPLREAILRTGGRPVADGFLTRDSLYQVRSEMNFFMDS